MLFLRAVFRAYVVHSLAETINLELKRCWLITTMKFLFCQIEMFPVTMSVVMIK